MSAKWTSNTLAGNPGSTDIKTPLGEQFVVLLLYGKNSFDDKIYSYLKITVNNLQHLKTAIKAGKGFNPSDFGEVVAAGKGEPSPETRAEIAASYQVLENQPASGGTSHALPTEKKNWDEY